MDTGDMHKNLVKIAHGSGDILADRQTDTQTDNTTYFSTAPAGKVIIYAGTLFIKSTHYICER